MLSRRFSLLTLFARQIWTHSNKSGLTQAVEVWKDLKEMHSHLTKPFGYEHLAKSSTPSFLRLIPHAGPICTFCKAFGRFAQPTALSVCWFFFPFQKWFKQRLAEWRKSEGLPSECGSVRD